MWVAYKPDLLVFEKDIFSEGNESRDEVAGGSPLPASVLGWGLCWEWECDGRWGGRRGKWHIFRDVPAVAEPAGGGVGGDAGAGADGSPAVGRE